MGHHEDAVAAIGARRRGIVTDELARDAKVPPHALDTLRSRGGLISGGKGVGRVRDHPFDYWAQCQAALDLAGSGAVLGLRSAARLHGFYAYRRAGEVGVIVGRVRVACTYVGPILPTPQR